MEHTKGPWKAQQYTGHPHYEIYADGPQRVASIEDHLADSCEIALLIAAAPALLEACKMVMMGFNLAKKTMPVNMRVAVEQFVKPALAKAEGGDK